VVRHRLQSDMFSASESAEREYRAETIDEYRELAMLAAHAWVGGAPEPGVSEGAPVEVAGEVKGPALR